jgi:hypothetical protein
VKSKQPKLLYLLFLLVTFTIIFIVNSCKREQKVAPLPQSVSNAQKWYESTYPKNLANSSLVTQGIGDKRDLSQITKPDWQHSSSYSRLGQNVIELPFDPSAKLNLTLKTNSWIFDKAYSRSYYLIINDKGKFDAYILTFIADSDYVKNDLTKLAHNSYRKLDPDYSGLVLYYTPKGDYIGGYGYRNGQLVQPDITNTQSGNQKVQSIDNGLLRPT